MQHIQKIFCLLIFALLVVACKKDDPEPTPEQNLTGKWKITTADVKLFAAGTDITEDFIGDSSDIVPDNTIIEFKADGTFTTIPEDGTPPQTGTWEFLENKTKIKFSGLFGDDSGFEDFLDAQTLAQIQTYNVAQLTSSALQIQNSTPVQVDIPNLPIPITIEVRQDITFAKQ
ncbi:lipocalin family protein [Hugenholtzia roseola]|uniref:lipocalin family protein n=1 Tax=Hugenholtzia roseola TaxID=1002 RepID=UPI00047AD22C|nr:lipocalin family protein [Hugenholtzia roseola]